MSVCTCSSLQKSSLKSRAIRLRWIKRESAQDGQIVKALGESENQVNEEAKQKCMSAVNREQTSRTYHQRGLSALSSELNTFKFSSKYVATLRSQIRLTFGAGSHVPSRLRSDFSLLDAAHRHRRRRSHLHRSVLKVTSGGYTFPSSDDIITLFVCSTTVIQGCQALNLPKAAWMEGRCQQSVCRR